MMNNTTCYRLVVCEKPSVARSIAAVLGAGKRGDGFLSGGGYLVSWCFGHLAELSDADAYDEKYGKWRILQILLGIQRSPLGREGNVNQLRLTEIVRFSCLIISCGCLADLFCCNGSVCRWERNQLVSGVLNRTSFMSIHMAGIRADDTLDRA